MSDDDPLWPDDLELGDEIAFEGDEYKVVGTGPGEARLERGDDATELEIFRWAFTNEVGFKLMTSMEQNNFDEVIIDD